MIHALSTCCVRLKAQQELLGGWVFGGCDCTIDEPSDLLGVLVGNAVDTTPTHPHCPWLFTDVVALPVQSTAGGRPKPSPTSPAMAAESSASGLRTPCSHRTPRPCRL